MSRSTARTLTATLVTTLAGTALGVLGATAPASAATATPADPPALATDLTYSQVVWDCSELSCTFQIAAPDDWTFVETAAHQGRFRDDSRTRLLAVGPASPARTVSARLATRLESLADLQDLEVLTTRVVRHDREGYRQATLRYRYVDAAGRARLVTTRFLNLGDGTGHLVGRTVTVAGAPADGAGLTEVLRHATRSMTVRS